MRRSYDLGLPKIGTHLTHRQAKYAASYQAEPFGQVLDWGESKVDQIGHPEIDGSMIIHFRF